jgi:EAL domain-containing protein (putative c-di-GMP-specific phosphodiesterase class I)
VADRNNKAWDLESLCRMKAMKGALVPPPGTKLFLNVNPNVLNDRRFIEDFRDHYLAKIGLDPKSIVFEITERSAVIDNHAFLLSISRYKAQGYKIAIDDVGAGYSGLNALSMVKPNLIKLDMHLVRNIDKDKTKQLICKAMVDFAKGSGIGMVAEGIETEEELATLIRLQVDYGQGFFLGIPKKSFAGIASEKVETIQKHRGKRYIEKTRASVYPIIGHLSKPGCCFSPFEKTERVYETMRLNPTITEFVIVEDDTTIGFITKSALNEKLGGRHGFDLFSHKQIAELTKNDFFEGQPQHDGRPRLPPCHAEAIRTSIRPDSGGEGRPVFWDSHH